MSKIIFFPQRDQMDCGPACLSMIASTYGKRYSVEYLREHSFLTREGVSLLGITEAAKKIGFETLSAKLSIEKLRKNHNALPCIIHWNQNHFVVLHRIGTKFRIADPAHGLVKLSEKDFCNAWLSDGEKGVVLFLTPTKKFHELQPPAQQKMSLRYLFGYLKSYRWLLFFMFVLLLLGSALTLVFPFLTQNLIDKGVNAKNMNAITIILLAQLGLFFGTIIFEIIRNWLMLFVGTKLSIKIISDFLRKLLKLPIKFFDTKMTGDFQQRIQDNERIEHFLTSQSLVTLFSMITFSVFFGVLWYYDFKILLIYLSLSTNR